MLSQVNISIIISCYNTKPEYLQEAVNSVYDYKGKYNYEIIICDDGSINADTLELLKTFAQTGIRVLYQENKGPAAARNKGVHHCNSEFILFLDSDNKIKPAYIDEGIAALLANTKAAVAYGDAAFFGNSREGEFFSGEFNIAKLLVSNYIDMCSVVRRQAWEDVGGLDENRIIIGHEDWEFWISLYKAGWQFMHLSKVLFDYRLRDNSLITQSLNEKKKEKIQYVFSKHWDLVYENFRKLHTNDIICKEDKKNPLRSFIKYSKAKYFK